MGVCTVFCLDSKVVAFTDSSNVEGLSAYAMDTIPEDLLQQAESGPSMGPEGVNRVWVSLNNPNPAVVETLQGLAKVVANRHLPRVQGWLKVLVKVIIYADCRIPLPLPLPCPLPPPPFQTITHTYAPPLCLWCQVHPKTVV